MYILWPVFYCLLSSTRVGWLMHWVLCLDAETRWSAPWWHKTPKTTDCSDDIARCGRLVVLLYDARFSADINVLLVSQHSQLREHSLGWLPFLSNCFIQTVFCPRLLCWIRFMTCGRACKHNVTANTVSWIAKYSLSNSIKTPFSSWH